MSAKQGKECRGKAVIRLNIHTDKELQQFMRAILPEFLRVVDPRQSGLLDVLYASDVITDSDNSSMSGKDVMTRKDQARKLFVLLNKLPVAKFQDKVAPELCDMFPHIIPEKFRVSVENGKSAQDKRQEAAADHDPCLLHTVQQRVRPARLADMLYYEDLLTLDEYSTITERARKKKEVWTMILDKFQNRSPPVQRQLEAVLRQLLGRYYIEVPHNMQDQITNGLPCTCPATQTPPDGSSLELEGNIKVQSWLDNGNFLVPKSLDTDSVPHQSTSLGFVRNLILPSEDVVSVSKSPSFRASSTGSFSPESDSEPESEAETIASVSGNGTEFPTGTSEPQRRKRRGEELAEGTSGGGEQSESGGQEPVLPPPPLKRRRRTKKDGCVIA